MCTRPLTAELTLGYSLISFKSIRWECFIAALPPTLTALQSSTLEPTDTSGSCSFSLSLTPSMSLSLHPCPTLSSAHLAQFAGLSTRFTSGLCSHYSFLFPAARPPPLRPSHSLLTPEIVHSHALQLELSDRPTALPLTHRQHHRHIQDTTKGDITIKSTILFPKYKR